MTSREFLIYVTVILAVMAVAALIETAVPMFAAHGREDGLQAANLGLTALSFVSKWLLASAAALAAVTLRAEGLLARADWSVWVQVGVGIVVLDFSVGYLSHRTMHMWPAMWRFHPIHHSDMFVDVTTTYRTHPVETVWRFLFAIVPRVGAWRARAGWSDPTPAASDEWRHRTLQHQAVATARSVALARLGHAERAQDSPLA